MKKNLFKISVLAIAILAIVSMIGLTVFAAETPEIIETKEITIESGDFDFYRQTRTNAADETKIDHRIIAVMKEEWLIDIAFAEVQIVFSNGTDSKTLTAVPQTVYETVYADTEEGRTVYTAAEGNIMLGWVVLGVPSDYTVTSATIDVSENLTVADALTVAGALQEDVSADAYTVSGVVSAVNGKVITVDEDGAVINVTVVTDNAIYVGNTVTVTGYLTKDGAMVDATLDALCYYTVTVEEVENGTVTVSKNENLVPGDTLTVTATAADGYKLVSVKVNGETVDAVDGVYTLTVTENITVSAEFEKEAPAEPTWQLVTNIADLAVGDQIVIVAAKENYAMGKTQNTNNRASVAITKNGNTVVINDNVQILTVKAGTTSGTFAFYTGSGYLYAGSSSKNYLKTETTLSANSSWKIEITAAGVATVKSSGANTRNWMRFNTSNNPKLFACYASGQTDIAIYKLSA